MTSSKGLETCYRQYRDQAAMYFVHMADRDPTGYWMNVSTYDDMRRRASEAMHCPSAVGVTIPRLVDDEQGTFDYLYRGHPFRLVIIDIDGRVAYCSRDGQADYESESMEATIGTVMTALAANGGRVTPAMMAADRCDAVGARPYPLWMAKVDFFRQPAPATGGKPTTTVTDAQGYTVEVTPTVAKAWAAKKAAVIRRFADGDAARVGRPVAMLFTGPTLDAASPALAAWQAWYQRNGRADGYLIASPREPAQADDLLRARATRVAAWRDQHRLTMPCLLDGLTNDAAVAYGADGPRLFIIAPEGGKTWVVRYASPPSGDLMTALNEAQRVLNGLTNR